MKAFFRTLGIDETTWMAECNATYKNGISFHGWSERPGCASYFHPFPSPIDAHTAPAFHYHCHARRRGVDLAACPDRFFLSAKLAAQRLAPIGYHNFPFEMAYGYHFDALLLGRFLRDHATAKGVRHIEGKVVEVKRSETGNISELHLEDGRALSADFFIDSTGFRSLLLQEALETPFVSYRDNLFNDAAVVLPMPPDAGGLRSETRSIAMGHGWRWEIPLTNRTGIGYVYARDFCSADDAERELRAALGLLDSPVEARHLSMKVGRVARHWVGNCLGVGLSQGFIEPLEATALHLVLATVETFIENFESNGFTNARQGAFNDAINARFEGVRDYIVCHYRMSQRSDTDYWRANAAIETLSPSLRAVLDCWFSGGDMREEIRRQDISRYYTAMSWQAMLGGYGHFPKKLRAPEADEKRFDMHVIDDFITRCALNFPAHSDMLTGAT
ncbi:MAG: tryptophan 7-halogenase [Sphingomonadales bacterium]